MNNNISNNFTNFNPNPVEPNHTFPEQSMPIYDNQNSFQQNFPQPQPYQSDPYAPPLNFNNPNSFQQNFPQPQPYQSDPYAQTSNFNNQNSFQQNFPQPQPYQSDPYAPPLNFNNQNSFQQNFPQSQPYHAPYAQPSNINNQNNFQPNFPQSQPYQSDPYVQPSNFNNQNSFQQSFPHSQPYHAPYAQTSNFNNQNSFQPNFPQSQPYQSDFYAQPSNFYNQNSFQQNFPQPPFSLPYSLPLQADNSTSRGNQNQTRRQYRRKAQKNNNSKYIEISSLEEAQKIKEKNLTKLYLKGESLYFIGEMVGKKTTTIDYYYEESSNFNNTTSLNITLPLANKVISISIFSTPLKEINLNNTNKIKKLSISRNNNLEKVNIFAPELLSCSIFKCKLKDLDFVANNMPKLKKLTVTNNKVTTIPPNLPASIQELKISHNSLTSLDNLSHLNQLKTIQAAQNRISTLPSDLPTSIKELMVSGNPISSLAPIANLSNLEEIGIADISGIRETPIEFLYFNNLRHVRYRGNWARNPTEVINTLSTIASSNSRSNISNAIPIDTQIKRWFQYGNRSEQSEITLIQIESLETNQKQSINAWLQRLSKTDDYKNNSKQLASIVCDILEHALLDDEFQKDFFNQVEVNLACCQDRAAMSLNEIYTSHILNQVKDLPLEEKMPHLIGCAKTIALREHLSQLIQQNKSEDGESVEIFLFWETKLRSRLNLKTAITSAHYGSMGNRQWTKEEDIVKHVEERYMDKLIEMDDIQKILNTDQSYQKERDAILHSRDEEMEAAYELPEGEMIKKLEEIQKDINSRLAQYQKEFLMSKGSQRSTLKKRKVENANQ